MEIVAPQPATIVGATLTQETPIGLVNGSNTSFFVTHEPIFVVSDTKHLIEVNNISDMGGNGYTYNIFTGEIVVSLDAPPQYFIVSYYNA